MFTLITVVKCEEIARSCIQCGPLFKQCKLLKHSPLEELECALAVWFKQTHESNASTDSTHFKDQALHIAVWESQTFQFPVVGSIDLIGD
jgi:hypothetical protein